MIVYRELSSLSRDLGIPEKTLYAMSNHISAHYRRVILLKKDGGQRVLSVPDAALKTIQRRILQVLLVHMPVSPYATAYRFGTSTVTNARPHTASPMVLKLDILHFFDSIRYSDVKAAAFPAEIYAEPLRILLTMLCYFGDALPQGAPSSPAITNILLRETDEKIGLWCRERNIVYTRYCDDMTFSGTFSPDEVIEMVRGELREKGLLLNGKKTRILRRSQRQVVTGIVVNEKMSVPASYRRKLRQELYYCRKFGISSHLQRTGLDVPEEAYRLRLLGRVNYVLRLSPEDPFFQAARVWLLQQKSEREECL